jgi:endoglucanase
MCGNTCHAQALSKYIVVDQFGYRPVAQKVAVLRDPTIGVDAAESFIPGSSYALINAANNAQVFTGAPTVWKNGKIDSVAGDKVWWFDFSSYTTPGSYYVLDIQKNLRSYTFNIQDDVYNEVLRHSVRFFFYQRSGFAKSLPYADAGWVDGASHLKPLQDKNCRYYLTPTSASSEKDVHGGWYDAGDLNKYTNWTAGYIMSLLLAYDENPAIWTDDYKIPESNNGVPDILDEVKWGMDYLLRLQNADGSIISLVGEASASPPSSATGQSLYGNVTTSSALRAAAAYAYGAKLYRKIGMPCYADSLQKAALKSWNWAQANPAVIWQNTNTGVGVGNPEVDDYGRLMYKLQAAEMLFALTGDTQYSTFFDNNYSQVHLIQWYYAFPYENENQEILLYYTTIPNATASVVSTIKSRYQTGVSFAAYDNKTSSYMSFLDSYTWGSNNIKSLQGLMFHDVVQYTISSSRNTDAINAAEGYIHYIHGLNPLNLCYLTNMGNYGAEKSTTCLWHSWFSFDSPKWSKVGASTYGPAPGFLVGGANASYNVDGCCPNNCSGAANNQKCSDPTALKAVGQPAMKSYADINDPWPLDSWSLSEPSCGYQVSYIRLLSKFVKVNGTPANGVTSCNANNTPPTVNLTAPAINSSFCQGTAITLTATAADADGTITKVDFYDGTILLGTATASPYTYIWTTAGAATHTVTAKSTDNGGKYTTSASISITVNAIPAAPDVTSTVAYCQGSTATQLTAIGTALKWYTVAAGGTGSASAPIPATTAASTISYYVSQTVNSCESPRASIAVTVNVLPMATISTTTSTTFCTGGSVVLTASAGSSYKWFNGTAQVGTAATYTATAAGSYMVEVINTGNCKATSAATSVTVNALPIIIPYSQVDGGTWNQTSSSTICSASTIILGPQPNVATGWTWSGPNGYSSAMGQITLLALTTTGNYTATYTDGNNCKATYVYAITVNAVPSAPAVIATAIYCQHATVPSLTATGKGLKWYTVATGGTGIATAPTPATTVTGTTNYYVSQTTTGCESTRALIAVTVTNIPTASISTTTSTTFCAGGSVILVASAGSSYKWFNGTTQVGTAATYIATTAGSYTVEVTNGGNCSATSSAKTITINELPTATITTTGSTNIPQGGSVVLAANIGSGLTYKWFKGSTQVGTGATYTATTAGVYIVEVSDASCTATSAGTTVNLNSNQPSVIVIASPSVNSTVQGPITIAVTATDPDGAIVLVEYLDGNTVIGTSTSQPYSFVWNNPGVGNHIITVRVRDSNGGITTSAPVSMTSEATSTGLFISNSNTLNGVLYPNPSNGIVFVDSGTDLSGASFTLIDVMGNEYQLSQTGNGLGTQIDLSTISDGTYVLIIRKDNSVLRKKVTVIK